MYLINIINAIGIFRRDISWSISIQKMTGSQQTPESP